MDPLTHSFAGLALGRLSRFQTVPRATLLGVLVANAPDLDGLAYFWGEDAALGCRRGLSHGPLGLLLLPVASALVVAGGSLGRQADPAVRSRTAREAFLLAFLGTWSHPALDWLNTYGIRLLHPFSERWFYGDTLFIADPWLWLLLFVLLGATRNRRSWLALAWAALAVLSALGLRNLGLPPGPWTAYVGLLAGTLGLRLLRGPAWSAELRQRRARLALLLGGSYILAMVLLGWTVRQATAKELRRLLPAAERWVVSPRLGELDRFDLVALTPEGVRFGEVDLRPEFGVRLRSPSEPALPRDPGPDLASKLRQPELQGFLGWTRLTWMRVVPDPAGQEWIYLLDGRYVRDFPPRRAFAWVVLPPEGPPLSAREAWRRRKQMPGLGDAH